MHSLNCAANNYNLNGNNSSNINPECFDLQFNSYLKEIIIRMNECKKYTNNQYMNYVQLKHEIEIKNRIINDFKLETLNLHRNNVVLHNKTTDMHRIMRLQAHPDWEMYRLNVLIRTMLKQRRGANGKISKLYSAIDGAYIRLQMRI